MAILVVDANVRGVHLLRNTARFEFGTWSVSSEGVLTWRHWWLMLTCAGVWNFARFKFETWFGVDSFHRRRTRGTRLLRTVRVWDHKRW